MTPGEPSFAKRVLFTRPRGVLAEAIALNVLLVGAIAIRLPFFHLGLWEDEAYSYYDVHADSWSAMFRAIDNTEGNPPLFFIALRLWCSIFGYGEVALKALPFLFGLAAIPITYLLARRIASARVAWLATIVIAFFGQTVGYSEEARPYTAAMLLVAVVAYAYVRLFVEGEKRWAACFIVAAIALIYTHYVGIFVLAGFAIGGLLFMRAQFGRLIAQLVVVGLAFVPWLPHMLHQRRNGTPWTNAPTPHGIASVLLHLFSMPLGGSLTSGVALGGGSGANVAVEIFGALVLIVTIAYLALLGRRSRVQAGYRNDPVLAIAGCAVATTIILEAILGLSYPRYLVPLLPLTAIFYLTFFADAFREAYGALHLTATRTTLAAVAAMAGVVLIVANVPVYRRDLREPKSGMRAAAQAAQAVNPRREAYLIDGDWAASTFGYYAPPGLTVRGFARWEHPEHFSIKGYGRLWSSPGLVTGALANIEKLSKTGDAELAVVRPLLANERQQDLGRMKRSRADVLIRRLLCRYRLVAVHNYRGWIEPASVLLFDLRAKPKVTNAFAKLALPRNFSFCGRS